MGVKSFNMTTLILLNGPPGSGKDYATKLIMEELAAEEPLHVKLSKPLKDIVMAYFGIDFAKLEAAKDTPDCNTSYRDVQINLFEQIARVLGKTWLAASLVNRIKQYDNNLIIVSDVGRDEELSYLIKHFGAKNILLIQIFRKGKSFQHDIRNYIDDPRVASSLIRNDGTSAFKLELMNEVYSFLNGET